MKKGICICLVLCILWIGSTFAVQWVRDITGFMDVPSYLVGGIRVDMIHQQIAPPYSVRHYLIRSVDSSYVYAYDDTERLFFYKLPHLQPIPQNETAVYARAIHLYLFFVKSPINPVLPQKPETLTQSLMNQIDTVYSLIQGFNTITPGLTELEKAKVDSIIEAYMHLTAGSAHRIDSKVEPKDTDRWYRLVETIQQQLNEARTSVDIRSIPLLFETIRDIHITHWHSGYPVWIYPDSLLKTLDQGWSNRPEPGMLQDWFNRRQLIEDRRWHPRRLAVNLALQAYLSLELSQTLWMINKDVAATLGDLDLSLVERFITQALIFHFLTVENFSIVIEAGTEKALNEMKTLYFSSPQAAPDPITYWFNHVWDWILDVSAFLSKDHQSHHLRWTYSTKGQPDLTEQVSMEPLVYKGKTSPLVTMIEIPSDHIHYVEVKMKVRYKELFSESKDTFTRYFPVYSPHGSIDSRLILPDFLWFVASHPGTSAMMLFDSLVREGTGLLSSNLLFQEYAMETGNALSLNPYYGLWQMQLPKDRIQMVQVLDDPTVRDIAETLFPPDLPLLNRFVRDERKLIRQLTTRHPVELYTMDSGEITSTLRTNNKKAIIFIHGKQHIYTINSVGEHIGYDYPVWLTKGRYNTWKSWFAYFQENQGDYPDYDFFEFIHDTSVLSTKAYGEGLATIMQHAGFFDQYDQIYLIAHSQGGLIARHAANTKVLIDGQPAYAGDHLARIVTLNSPHHGTILQSFSCVVNPALDNWIHHPDRSGPEVDVSLWNLMWMALEGRLLEGAADTIITLAGIRPMYIGKLFSEIVGMLDPFPGGKSMEYTFTSFIQDAARALYVDLPETKIGLMFPQNQELDTLNEEDRFYEKLVLVGSSVSQVGKLGNRTLAAPFLFMKTVAEATSQIYGVDYDRHAVNDGVVPLVSQMMEGIERGQGRLVFYERDHEQITSDTQVIQRILRLIMTEE